MTPGEGSYLIPRFDERDNEIEVITKGKSERRCGGKGWFWRKGLSEFLGIVLA